MPRRKKVNHKPSNHGYDIRERVITALAQVKKERAGKKYKLVKDPVNPRCFIEIEVK
jgi:hypothetical protein